MCKKIVKYIYTGKFGWSDEDIEMLSRAEIIVAADGKYKSISFWLVIEK